MTLSAEDRIAALARSALFRGFPVDALQDLAAAGEESQPPAGHRLGRDGDPMERVHLVLAGTLLGGAGQPLVPGEVPDEASLLLGGAYTQDWTAGGSCRLLAFPRAPVMALAARHPAAWQARVDAASVAVLEEALRAALQPLIGATAADVARRITAQGRWWHMARGETLLNEGEAPQAWYVVATGQLSALRGSGDARRVVGRIRPGELIGELSLLTGNPAGATVVANRDCWLARFEVDEFRELVLARPQAVQLLVRTLIDRFGRGADRSPAGGVDTMAVLPLPGTPPLDGFVAQLVAQLARLGPVETLDAARCEALGLVHDPQARLRGDVEWLRLEAWVDRQQARGRRVLLVGDGQEGGWTRQVQLAADRVLLVADAAGSPAAGPPAAIVDPGAVQPHRLLCLVHPAQCPRPGGTAAWLDALRPRAHHHVRDGRAADFARLARHLAGQAVGLALSGGGARGPAHAGVLRALQEAGVPVDFVAGASAGALMACLLAQDDGWLEVHDRSVAGIAYPPGPFSDFTLPMVAMLKSRRLHDAVRSTYGDERLEDSWIPCAVVTTNLTQARSQVFTRGPVWEAALASISPPAIAKPRLIDGDLHCDGGLMNNLPVSVLRDHGCRWLAASSIGTAIALSLPSGQFPNEWLMFVDRFVGNGSRTAGVPSAMEILMAATMLGSEASLARESGALDLHLHPDLSGFGSTDFRRLHELAAKAHADARQQLQARRARDEGRGLWQVVDAFAADGR